MLLQASKSACNILAFQLLTQILLKYYYYVVYKHSSATLAVCLLPNQNKSGWTGQQDEEKLCRFPVFQLSHWIRITECQVHILTAVPWGLHSAFWLRLHLSQSSFLNFFTSSIVLLKPRHQFILFLLTITWYYCSLCGAFLYPSQSCP